MATKYEFKKLANLGFELKDDKTCSLLNRVISVDAESLPRQITSEPDARRAHLLIKDLNLDKASGVETLAEHRSADK